MDQLDWIITVAKCLFIFIVLFHVAPIMAWVERRGSAVMQNRAGPNRVGPLGLLQSLADGIKFLFKEDPVPGHVNPFYYVLAPVVSLVPAMMAFAVIPFAGDITLADGRIISFQLADLNVGILYVLAVGSLAVYAVIMAGWASNNKYALLGSLRSSSQMISYELTMGLSLVSMVMIYSSVHLSQMTTLQGQDWIHLGPLSIPAWGLFMQPLSCLLFVISAFAETNRLPFDLPEGESEIVAGYHLEYGSMKFALFMMSEYIHMFTASGMITAIFLGGWQLLPGMEWMIAQVPLTGVELDWVRVGFQALSFFSKVGFLMWFFVWVRWTLPRFRFDQLMDLGWKALLPLSLANVFLTGLLIAWGVY